jgi:hypothetical protein
MKQLIACFAILAVLCTGCTSEPAQPTRDASKALPSSTPRPTAAPAQFQPISPSSPQYQIIGHFGLTYDVVVNPSLDADRSGLMAIAQAVCSDPGLKCYISFWDDVNRAPTTADTSSAQDQAIIATYGQNPSTGYQQLLVCALSEC